MNSQVVVFNGTPWLSPTTTSSARRVGGKDATEEQLNKLEGIRRLLLRAEAVRAVSWLWVPTLLFHEWGHPSFPPSLPAA